MPRYGTSVHLQFAAATAAVVCAHAGAYAPSLEEIDQLLMDANGQDMPV